MFKRTAQVLGLALAFCLTPAWGLGLGEITVESYLNQPLRATIRINSATEAEIEGLQVKLADAAAFERLGMDVHDYLLGVSFEVVREGTPKILVKGKEIAREPFLSFVVDARWVGGRLQREYTVLLDPPDIAAARQPAPTVKEGPSPESTPPRAAPAPQPQPAQPEPARESEPPVAAPRQETAAPRAATPTAEPSVPRPTQVSPTRSYGPVAPKETLWSIATKLRPDPAQVTMNQMLVALYDHNPEAFADGIGSLQRGSVLKVPSLEQILAVDAQTAKRRVDAQRGTPPPRRVAASKPTPKPKPAAPAAEPPTREPAYTSFDEVTSAEPKPARTQPEAAPEPAAPEAEPEDSGRSDPAPRTAGSGAEAGSALSRLQALSEDEAGDDEAGYGEPSDAGGATDEPEMLDDAELTLAPADDEFGDAQSIDTADQELIDEPADEEPVSEAEVADSDPVETTAAPLPAAPTAQSALPWGMMAGGLAVLLAAVGGLLFLRKRRQAASDAPVAVAPVVAPQPSPQPAPAPAPAEPSAMDEAEQDPIDEFASTMESTQSDLEATSEPAVAPDLAPEAPAEPEPAVGDEDSPTGDEVDFDVTEQFASETMQINLDANDPLSEADFHLAYGLYDEAALLLKTALENEPERTEIKVKLAETYFAGGKSDEFMELARELKNELPDAEWQKVAIMGSQIAPDDALFQGGGDGGDLAAGGVDLDFGSDADEPAVADEDAPLELDLDMGGDATEEAATPPADVAGADEAAEEAGDGSLEFDLGDFDLGDEADSEEPTTDDAAAEPAAADADQGLSLDLDEAAESPEPSEPKPEPVVETGSDDDASLDFEGLDLDGPDGATDTADAVPAGGGDDEDLSLDDLAAELDRDAAPEPEIGPDTVVVPAEPESPAADAEEDDEFDLSDLALDDEDSTESDQISDGDEASTKLDLARAYIDMGDSDMARGLLDEVVQAGNDQQKAEAEELLGRLS